MNPPVPPPPVACPTRRHLERLLDDADDPALSAHVESCPACQAILDELTAVTPVPAAMAGHDSGASRSLSRGSDGHLLRLRGLLSTASAVLTGADETVADDVDLEDVDLDAVDLDAVARPAPDRDDRPVLPGYEVGRPLGRGGMAVVYEARHLRLNRQVAVKVIRGDRATAEQLVRFGAEAQIIAGLRHPNIIQVYEVGTAAAGQPYFAMELVEGGTLADAVAGRPAPPRLAAAVGETLARAVQHAHSRGVLHRDLKPSNVLLDGPPPDPTDPAHPLTGRSPKVSDFGLAKPLDDAHDPGLTRVGHVVGTPHYLAPEQAQGRPDRITVATDVYSLGATLYEMLVGRPPFAAPFESPTAHEVMNRVMHAPPPPPSRAAPGISRDLDVICLKCLEKDSDRRYPTAAALAEDLRRFLDGRPIAGRPVGTVEQVQRWVRRRPVVAGMAAALALALVGGAGTSTYFAVKASHRATLARAEKDRATTARDAARAAERTMARQSADLLLDRGVQMAAGGDVVDGLPWMAEALRLTPDPDVQRIARVDLATWAAAAPTLVAWLDTADTTAAVTPDGRRVVTAGKTGTPDSDDPVAFQFWDLPAGTRAGPPLVTPDLGVAMMTFSPDGTRLLTGNGGSQRYQGRPGWANVWDVAGRRIVGRAVGHADAVNVTAWLPDGRRFVTGSADHTVRVWSADTCEPVGRPMLNPDAVIRLAVGPDGNWLLAATARTIRAWSVDRDEPARGSGFAVPADTGIDDVAVAPDGRRLYVLVHRSDAAGFRLLVQPWDADAGKPVGSAVTMPFPSDRITVLPDGRTLGRPQSGPGGRLFTTIGDGVQVWAAPARPQPGIDDVRLPLIDATARHPSPAPTFNPTGNWLWRAAADGKQIETLDGQTGRPAGPSLPRLDDNSPRVAAAADGTRFAAVMPPPGGWDPTAHTAQLFDRGGHPVGPPLSLVNTVISLAFSPDSTRLAAGGHGHVVRLYDARTGRAIGEPLPQGDMVDAVRFSADGRTLAVATYGREVRLWDVATCAPRGAPLAADGPVYAVAVSPAGDRVAGASDRAAYLWDALTGRRIAVLAYDPPVGNGVDAVEPTVQFSPDGRTLLTSAGFGTCRLWDPVDGRPLGLPLRPPAGGIDARRCRFAFSPDGRLVAAGHEDGTAQLWDVTTARPLGAPRDVPAGIGDVRFDTDGRSFRVATPDGTVLHLPVPTLSAVPADDLARDVRRSTGRAVDGERVLRPLARGEWDDPRHVDP